jgi:hypothetical protein
LIDSGKFIKTLTIAITALVMGCGGDHNAHQGHENMPIVERTIPVQKPNTNVKGILANPVWIAKGKKSKTLKLTIIASHDISNGGMNFNGEMKGSASYEIPKGYTVNVIFINKSAAPHSAVIVDEDKSSQLMVGAPYFKGAASNNPKDGSSQNKIESFSFVADEEGAYIVACGFPSHTLAGQWIYFNVGSSSTKPCYKTEKKTFYAK